MKAKWSVVAFHDCEEARETAVGFCDRLVKRFWADSDVQIQWCSFASLNEHAEAQGAATGAVSADLIVFATTETSAIPVHTKRWIEHWLQSRGDREGVLVGLSTAGSTAPTESQVYLRGIAHRAGMDFLTDVPQTITHPIPESPESFSARAHQVTSVLDEILHRPPPRALS